MHESRLASRPWAWLATLHLCLLTGGCISIDLPGGRPGPLLESVVAGKGSAKILLVEIEGLIVESPRADRLGLGVEESMVGRVRAQLEKGAEDDGVKAVVLRIQSPGGTATASEILYREIKRYKKKTGRPVVAQFMGIATSGAYYAAMGADAVYAYPTTVTGSIGVVWSGLNLSGLMEKLGISDQTFIAGQYKDAGSALRPMRPPEREQIQSVLDDLYERFRQVVAEGRPHLGPERLGEVADGRIFSASQAMEWGLIDGVIDLPEAVAEARRRAGVEEARVVTYHRRREWTENLYTRPPGPRGTLAELLSLLEGPSPAGFLYLWQPGRF
ncbi:MAG: signal peptide peptidase SppA [Myxococcota bacterium]